MIVITITELSSKILLMAQYLKFWRIWQIIFIFLDRCLVFFVLLLTLYGFTINDTHKNLYIKIF